MKLLRLTFTNFEEAELKLKEYKLNLISEQFIS